MANRNVEAIVVLGRGIGKDANGNWQPTGYFEILDNGHHSGILDKHPDQNNPNSVIAGGKINVLAAYYLYKKLCQECRPPKLIIFAAGRPNYLKNESPQISEGVVMRDEFLKKIKRAHLDIPNIAILSKNKNTQDDIQQSLLTLKKETITNAIYVTVKVHIKRAEYVKLLLTKTANNSKISFVSSEEIVGKSNNKYKHLLQKATKTMAYKRISLMEERGIIFLRQNNNEFI